MSHPMYTMTPLPDHKYFEALLGRGKDERIKVMPKYVIVYFTAEWCGYCRDLNHKQIVEAFLFTDVTKCFLANLNRSAVAPDYGWPQDLIIFIDDNQAVHLVEVRAYEAATSVPLVVPPSVPEK